MMASQYVFDFNPSGASAPRRRKPYGFAFLMFIAAYFITVTVHAQQGVDAPPAAQDEITLGSDKIASVTGTVVAADEDWVLISSAGREMRILLDKVHMRTEADNVFTPGMTVFVDGTMRGEDFGVLVMRANTITATAPQTLPQAQADSVQ